MDSKNQKSDIMEMLQTINNNKGVVQTKNILKALNKMGMDWIKRTIHQSTIWQRIKTILVTMFILSALLSLSAPKGVDGKVKLDQIITYKTVEVQKSNINIKNVADESLKKKYEDYKKTDMIEVPKSSFVNEFKERGWFNAMFVYPISQLINIFGDIFTPTFSLVLLTSAIQIILIVINTASMKKQVLLNSVKEEVKVIKEKIKLSESKEEIKQYRKEIKQLYRKNKVHPFIQAIAPFLNLPIIFGIYYAAQRAYCLVSGTFMGASLAMSPVEGLRTGSTILVVIYFIMVGCYIFQSLFADILKRIYNKTHENKREVKTIGNIIMALFWVFIIVKVYWCWPITLSIYWLVSVLFTCVQIVINERYAIKHVLSNQKKIS